jgi:hypothetical protein
MEGDGGPFWIAWNHGPRLLKENGWCSRFLSICWRLASTEHDGGHRSPQLFVKSCKQLAHRKNVTLNKHRVSSDTLRGGE